MYMIKLHKKCFFNIWKLKTNCFTFDLSGFIKVISIIRNSLFLNNRLYKLYMAEGRCGIIHDILYWSYTGVIYLNNTIQSQHKLSRTNKTSNPIHTIWSYLTQWLLNNLEHTCVLFIFLSVYHHYHISYWVQHILVLKISWWVQKSGYWINL